MEMHEDLVKLGRTDLQVSPMGVGTNRWGHNRTEDPTLGETFEAALDAGFTLFDTAEIYNFGGSEKTLGQFLPGNHRPVTVASKFLPLPWRLGKRALLHALHASLDRLKIDALDLYLIHMQWPPVPVETWMDALAEAKQAGLVRAVGVSNYDVAHLRRAQAALARHGLPLACNQVEYSLLKLDIERNGVKAACEELGVTLVAYRPLAGGFLTGKYSSQNPPQGPRRWMYPVGDAARIQPLLDVMSKIGQAHGGKIQSQVALNWVLCKHALPIPGATKVRHIGENIGALGWRMSEEEVAILDAATDNLYHARKS